MAKNIQLTCSCGKKIQAPLPKRRNGFVSFILTLFWLSVGFLAGILASPGYAGIIPAKEDAWQKIAQVSKNLQKQKPKTSPQKKIDTPKKEDKEPITKQKQNLTPKKPVAAKEKQSKSQKRAPSRIIGKWQNKSKSRTFHFENKGEGFLLQEKKYGNHHYLYNRSFNWHQKDETVVLKYTLETTIRNGNEIIRERDLSKQTSYTLQNNKLVGKDTLVRVK